jgi:phospholipid transport system substrate-binding protein
MDSMSTLRNTLTKCGLALVFVLAPPAAFTQDLTPDVLINTVLQEVIAALKEDKDLRGNRRKIAELVEAKVVPHFNFARMTQIAMAANWRHATPEQQEQLTREFKTLLVRTYAGAIANYREQIIEVRPIRVRPSHTEVTVRSEVRQPETEPIAVDYEMEKTASGWKIYDVRMGGVSLVTTYRNRFAEEIRNCGIDGLLNSLASKNRQHEPKSVPAAA